MLNCCKSNAFGRLRFKFRFFKTKSHNCLLQIAYFLSAQPYFKIGHALAGNENFVRILRGQFEFQTSVEMLTDFLNRRQIDQQLAIDAEKLLWIDRRLEFVERIFNKMFFILKNLQLCQTVFRKKYATSAASTDDKCCQIFTKNRSR